MEYLQHFSSTIIPCSVLNNTYSLPFTVHDFSFKNLQILGGDSGAGFAPSFVEKPKIIPNETGTLITMKCKCKANPKPVVTWYRGTNIVKESAKIKMTVINKEEDIYEMSLEIKVYIARDSFELTNLLLIVFRILSDQMVVLTGVTLKTNSGKATLI